MKKIASFLVIIILSLFIGHNFAIASDSGCDGSGAYSKTTGQLCNTNTPSQITTLSSQLKIGSKGDTVKTLQQMLKDSGFLSGKVDGVYGKMTSAAIINYLKTHPAVPDPSPQATAPTPTESLSTVTFSPNSGAAGTISTLLNAFSLTCTASIASLCIPNDFYKTKFEWMKEGQTGQVPADFAVGGYDFSRGGGNLSLGNGGANGTNGTKVQFTVPASFSPGVYDLVIQDTTTSIRKVTSFTITSN